MNNDRLNAEPSEIDRWIASMREAKAGTSFFKRVFYTQNLEPVDRLGFSKTFKKGFQLFITVLPGWIGIAVGLSLPKALVISAIGYLASKWLMLLMRKLKVDSLNDSDLDYESLIGKPVVVIRNYGQFRQGMQFTPIAIHAFYSKPYFLFKGGSSCRCECFEPIEGW